jgi:hypothetical protein
MSWFKDPLDLQRSSPTDLAEDDWQRVKRSLHTAVVNIHQEESKKLSLKLHHFTISNQLLKHKNQGPREALLTRKKHQVKGKAPNHQQRQEYYSRGGWWSPQKLGEGYT